MERHKKASADHGGQKQENPQQTTFGGTENETPWTEKILSTGELYSGQPYQRPVKDRLVDRLVREWDPRLLTPLVVSYRDGHYYLVDGQHRICGIRKKNNGKDVDMLCQVYYGLTYEEEAELYYKLDQAKGHLRLAHATKALLESGSNAEITEINRLLEDVGFVWILDKPAREAFEIEATRTIINAYRLLGGASFSRMLMLIAKTWHGASNSLKASIISGMALFLKTYETELNDATFIQRLSTVDPDEIIRRGKVDFSTNKAALRFARVIWDKYNGQQRGGRKLPYRFKG
ncbi:MAG: hypothetical protein HDT16_05975 [Oscillibacter sp.]|nr:hypothetical protein [Oscillibacter sp.]